MPPKTSAHPTQEISSTKLGAWLFVRLLGLIYLLALISLWTQIDGLIGSRGILPAAPWLEAVSEQLGGARWTRVPTLFWLEASDAALHLVCGAGVLLALLVILGLAELPALVGLWAVYLSLCSIGRVFLGFQWDNLLLECGLLAIFLFPLRWRSRIGETPLPVALWLLRWLLFRLMWSSGVVKLTSGDTTWRDLTALQFHYETQPLPPWTAWYVHHLPDWLHKLSAVGMFAIELVVPFLIFAPQRFRRIAAAVFLLLQLTIIATGNYGFFNFLSAALCFLLVDDALLRPILPGKWKATAGTAHQRPLWQRRLWSAATLPLALVIAVLTPIQLLGALRVEVDWPRPCLELYAKASPLRSINGYGLFAVMTTERPEILVEGSADGRTWHAYRFKWKPGKLDARPRFMAPHMPRLDWQMWFAALGDVRRNPWFVAFLGRLAEGEPEVLELLAKNPFPDEPPRFLRARIERYRFSETLENGHWWKMEPAGEYMGAMPADRLRALLR